MRDLKEYKAEIYRRSEERIVERIENKKRRKKLLMSLCVPLCLAILISSVIILPSLIGEDQESYENIGATDGASSGKTEVYYLYADITYGFDRSPAIRTDDPEFINKLSNVIIEAYADSYLWYDINERAEYAAEDEEAPPNDHEMDDVITENITETEAESYTVTLTATDGYKKIIIIEGNTVIDPELNMDVTLKESRLEELKELLISVY